MTAERTIISKTSLGGRVRRAREENGYTRYRLMKLTGVSHGTIESIENGQAYPRIDTLLLIAGALGCTVGELTEENPK